MTGVIHYLHVFQAFLKNALIRELQFRSNFVITLVTRGVWFGAQLVLFELIFQKVPLIRDWSRHEYFIFMATGMLINSLVEAFFMPNCAQFSEMIRTGNLDFALLKPIDTQFLISFEKMDLAMTTQLLLSACLMGFALSHLQRTPSVAEIVMFGLLVLAAVTFFYSLMLALACSSIFFGRNQGLLDFWFYVTVFARYPGSIYSGSPTAEVFRFLFSYLVPILLVVTVPAQVMATKVLVPGWIGLFAIALGPVSLLVSRMIFQWSLKHYRSASS